MRLEKKVRPHIYISYWPMPYSWCKPQAKRWKNGDWTICWGFGQIEKITDY